MGCDIHMYVHFKEKKGDYWRCFGGRINPGRNYDMFTVLANVRGYNSNYFLPKGLPDHELSYECEDDLYLRITKDGQGDDEVTMERALEWNKIYRRPFKNDKNGNPIKIQHPDWHSHSWLTIKELKQAYKWYNDMLKKEFGSSRIPSEYQAILDLMISLEKSGNDVELIFWFDN